MPSFDVVSEIDSHELNNAVDQANREISTRFDFKGIEASFERNDFTITLRAPSDFQVQQMLDILKGKLTKRDIDIKCLDAGDIQTHLGGARQEVIARQGLDKELAKKVVKIIKESKLKVQSAIQGEQVRITGKKRDDLQQAIAVLREAPIDMPLQYTNFRD